MKTEKKKLLTWRIRNVARKVVDFGEFRWERCINNAQQRQQSASDVTMRVSMVSKAKSESNQTKTTKKMPNQAEKNIIFLLMLVLVLVLTMMSFQNCNKNSNKSTMNFCRFGHTTNPKATHPQKNST